MMFGVTSGISLFRVDFPGTLLVCSFDFVCCLFGSGIGSFSAFEF